MSILSFTTTYIDPRPSPLDKIPNEVLLQIFELLPKQDHGNFSLVSPKMYRISRPAFMRVFRATLATSTAGRRLTQLMLRPELSTFTRELELSTPPDHHYDVHIKSSWTKRFIPLLASLDHLQVLRVDKGVRLSLTLLQIIIDHPSLHTLDYTRLSYLLSTLDGVLVRPPHPRQPLLVPNLVNWTGSGKRDLLDSTYLPSGRQNLLSSGIFTFDTLTFRFFPGGYRSRSQAPWTWTFVPGLRRIVFEDYPEPDAKASEIACWLDQAIRIQPELADIVIDLESTDADARHHEREGMRILATLPWFEQLQFVSQQEIAQDSTWEGYKFVATKGKGIVSTTFRFRNLCGNGPFLHAAGLNLPNLTTLELSGINYPSWNNVLRALKPFTSLKTLRIKDFLLPWHSSSKIPYCSDLCSSRVKQHHPRIWSETETLGGPLVIWESLVLPANLSRLRSLGRVLPHGCEVLWEPRPNDCPYLPPRFGLWRWTVARGKWNGGMMVFDERGSDVVLPRTLEMFQGQREGICWTCNEYDVMGGDEREDWFSEIDEEWEGDREDLEDWTRSSEDVCEGDPVPGWD